MAYTQTQKQYANRIKVSQPRISQFIRDGKLKGAFRKKENRYYIDPEKADKALLKNLDPMNPIKAKLKQKPSSKKKAKTTKKKV